MISDNQSICPKCGGQLKYYDNVQRLVRTKFGNKKWSSCNGDIYWIDFNHHRLTLDDGMEIYVIDMVFEPTAEWMEDL